MPDLNNEGRFLRGAAESGVVQEMDWKSFQIVSEQGSYVHGLLIPKSGYNNTGIFTGKWEWPASRLRFKFDETSEVRPPNMSVVWIMRIK